MYKRQLPGQGAYEDVLTGVYGPADGSFTQTYPVSQDWSGYNGLSFWYYGSNSGQPITLKAHPDDAAELGADLPEAVRLEADPALAPGEIRAHGARLVIDASWAVRLAALHEPLVALLRARREGTP